MPEQIQTFLNLFVYILFILGTLGTSYVLSGLGFKLIIKSIDMKRSLK